jgi:hypothetical protein
MEKQKIGDVVPDVVKTKARPIAQPGKFEVKVKVVQSMNAEAKNLFTADFSGYESVVTSFASLAGDVEGRGTLNDGDVDLQAYEEKVLRMGNMVLAKKLASSIDAEDNLMYDSQLRGIVNAKIQAPTGLISLVDGYGHIDTKEDGKWKMIGQAYHAVDRYIRAVATDAEMIGADRRSVFCINLAMPGSVAGLREICMGQINGWGESIGPIDLQIAPGVTMRAKMPVLMGLGASVHRHMAGAVNRPINVVRAYEVAIQCDVVLLRDAGGIPIDAERVELERLGVRMVGWNRDHRAAKEAAYAQDVQIKLNRTMSKITNWVEVQRMKPQGDMWQMCAKTNGTHFKSFTQIVGPGLDYGPLLGGEATFVVATSRYEQAFEETQSMRIVSYAIGMVRKG